MRKRHAVLTAVTLLTACAHRHADQTEVKSNTPIKPIVEEAAAPPSTIITSTTVAPTTTTVAPTTTTTAAPKPAEDPAHPYPVGEAQFGCYPRDKARQAICPNPPTTAPPKAGTGRYLGSFYATCYDDRGTTANGDQAGWQSLAVDPNVIPLGTRVYVGGGVGNRVADDTGGAIHGNRIDVWRSDCNGWPNPMLDVYAA